MSTDDRARAIIEASLDAIVTIDHIGHIIEWNPSAERMFGWPANRVLGRELAEVIIPPELRERHRAGLARYLEGGPSTLLGGRVEMTALRIDGSRVPVDLEIVRLGNEWPPTFTGFICDITARKRAQRELAETVAALQEALAGAHASEARFRLLADVTHDAIWDWDLVTDEVWWSEGMKNLFGYSLDELEKTSISWTSRIADDDRARVMDGIHAVIDGTRNDWADTYLFRRNDGTHAYIMDRGRVIRDEGGKAVRMVGGMTDITEQRDAREEVLRLNSELEARVRRRTAQLEAANSELEAFSYSISHDLRAPLRAVDGFTRTVLDRYASLLPEEGVGYLERARAGAQNMSALIDDLLAFSRLSRLPLTRQELSMQEIVQEALKTVLEAYPGRAGDVVVGPLEDCVGDAALLKQVWINLLSNAFKYTSRTANPRIEVGSRKAETTVYYVKDNGAGFDPRYANKLFAVFQRLHGVNEYPGTGVGLAIAHRIIARHGGRIGAEGEENRGATFSFTLE
jgi:PAS domain S-box-containing protein